MQAVREHVGVDVLAAACGGQPQQLFGGRVDRGRVGGDAHVLMVVVMVVDAVVVSSRWSRRVGGGVVGHRWDEAAAESIVCANATYCAVKVGIHHGPRDLKPH